jgi:hypothetical protein
MIDSLKILLNELHCVFALNGVAFNYVKVRLRR